MDMSVKEVVSDIIVNAKKGKADLPKEISAEEKVNNFLDALIDINKAFKKSNRSMNIIFNGLDKLSHASIENEDDEDQINKLLRILDRFYKDLSLSYSRYIKAELLQKGSKSYLEDMQIHIRTLREYITDIRQLYFPSEEDKALNSELAALI